MKLEHLQMEFWETYYFANIVHNVITDPSPFVVGLDEFYGDNRYKQFLRPFPKFSALHSFTEFIVQSVMAERIDDVVLDSIVQHKGEGFWVNDALKHHGFEHVGLKEWMAKEGIDLSDLSEDDLNEYERFLYDEGPLERLEEQFVEEVFYLAFSNSGLLRDFNSLIAQIISEKTLDELDDDDLPFFRKDGVLKRRSIPSWIRRAVFYRDRGSCGACNRDISGLISLKSQKHFDHVVPLASGGMNDVTNIQLLCEQCNLRKKHHGHFTSSQYERWY